MKAAKNDEPVLGAVKNIIFFSRNRKKKISKPFENENKG